ncbi:MAG TPA: SIS domain-containing protein [Acidobacteriota bacterium]|nr:SIS domain-containing protein [Acidobacteriota bacterium]
MSAETYFKQAETLIERIRESQFDRILQAAAWMADSIQAGGWVYLFGSGHSVLPVLDVFPRYGSFVGFRPLADPRLMWCNVVGPGGAPPLLWLERQEGYIANVLQDYSFSSRDCLVVYSHGGLNAAPVEAALYAREKGTRVIAVTSLANYRTRAATHSSGMKLADVADIAIDNCVPAEDALVDVGRPEKVGAGSTLAVIAISMALVAETAAQLVRRGVTLHTFVSPNVAGVSPDHNEQVYDAYRRRLRS